MSRADFLFTGIADLATMATGAIPRCGPAMEELGRIENAAIAVAGRRVVAVGREPTVLREVRLRTTGYRIDLGGASVVPGFVDAHTHLLFAGDRLEELNARLHGVSSAEIRRSWGGILSTVRRTRAATDAALLQESSARIERMGRYGTIAAEVKSGYALTNEGELRLLRLIPLLARRTGMSLIPTFLGAHAIPPEFTGHANRWIEILLRQTLPAIHRERLAQFCDVFCEPGFFTVAQSDRLLRGAQQHSLSLKIHADEMVASGGALLAAKRKAISADHLLATPSGEFEALARAGVTAVLLPVTPLCAFLSRRAPGRELVDAGVPVALGTDLSPQSWVESMTVVLSHAMYSARLTPAEALTAATVNAAHAIGRGTDFGRIAPGLPAHFVAFSVRTVEAIPYRIGIIPTHVVRNGRRIAFPPSFVKARA